MFEIKRELLTLENGMRIIALPDHRRPVVYIASMLNVGSKDEKKGAYGYAHLCEHLMFTGTPKTPDFDLATAIDGGSNNAWTNADYTCYLNYGPPHLHDEILKIEADRFLNLPHALSQDTFETEKEVVLNELREDLDGSPYGDLHHNAHMALHGPDHPYGHPVIGNEDDLIQANRQNVQQFFNQNYSPEKMVLVIAGDIDPKTSLLNAKKAFSPMQRQASDPINLGYSSLNSHQAALVKHAASTYAYLSIEWLTLGKQSQESQGLAILEIILGDSSQGLLIKELELSLELANQVECISYSQGQTGQFSLSMIPNSNTDIPIIIDVIKAQLTSVAAHGVQENLFAMAKKRVWLNWLLEWERLETRAEMALEWLMWNHQLEGIQREAQKILSISQSDMKNLAADLLTRRPLVIQGLTT